MRMSEEMVANLIQQALLTTLYVAGPVLLLGLLAGLVISVFQATTQINEQTLTFIPKILVVLFAIIVFGPWMYNTMIEFTQSVFAQIPQVVR